MVFTKWAVKLDGLQMMTNNQKSKQTKNPIAVKLSGFYFIVYLFLF